jgi:retinol dehydrogenase-14
MEILKVATVTGSNCRLGLATATSLWKDQKCHVVIACRDEKKAKAAMTSICGSEGHERLEFIPLDLGSLESVNKFAEDFNAKHKHIDILINNAGVVSSLS